MAQYHGIDTPIIMRQIKKAMRYPRVMVKVRYAVGPQFHTAFLQVKLREFQHLATGKMPVLLQASKHTSTLVQYYDFASNTFKGLSDFEGNDGVIDNLPVTASTVETEIEKIKAAFVKAVNQPPGTTLTVHVQYIRGGKPQEKRFNRHSVIQGANLRTRTRAVKREIAARRIQRAWKNASSNPHNPMGHRMLMNEFKSHLEDAT